MPLLGIDANGRLVINNGVAYGLVAGGAVSFISAEWKWYIGNNVTEYANMLYSRGVEPPMIYAVLGIRAAITEAAAHHAIDLGTLVGGNALQLSAAETLDDAEMRQLTIAARLPAETCNVAQYALLAVHAAAVAAGQQPNAVAAVAPGYVADRLHPNMVKALLDEGVKLFAAACARMAYSIIATNALGLITSSHHLRGPAEGLAENILELYEIKRMYRELGVDAKEATKLIFHHALHPLAYEHVAAWGQAIPAASGPKIAAPCGLRLPAFPASTTFVKNGWKAQELISTAPLLATIWGVVSQTPGKARLEALKAAILASPLDYSMTFRPVQAAAHQPAIDATKSYVACLAGVYDAYITRGVKRPQDGPTTGPGFVKFLGEFHTAYVTARDAALLEITAVQAQPAAGMAAIFAQLCA